jgi:hypothetical protein
LTLGVIAVLACAFAVAPSASIAQDCGEYCTVIPDPGGNGADPSANTSGSGSSEQPTTPATTPTTTPEATTPAEPTTPTDEAESDDDESGAAGGGKGDDKGDGTGASKAADREKTLSTSDATPVASKSPNDDGGGVPVLLIVIAALAALGAGFAAWRMRRDSSGGSGLTRTAEISRGA